MTTATRSGKFSRGSSADARSDAPPALYLAFELGVDEWRIGFAKALSTKARVGVNRGYCTAEVQMLVEGALCRLRVRTLRPLSRRGAFLEARPGAAQRISHEGSGSSSQRG